MGNTELIELSAAGDFDDVCAALERWGWDTGALAGCAQDPLHHGEGDVLRHTRLVCEALASDTEWCGLGELQRGLVYLAAALHDIAKPETTRIEDGRIRHPGHARRGAHMARELLWRAGLDWRSREQISACVAYHLKPSFLLEFDDPGRQARVMAEDVTLSWLCMLARADVNGRACADAPELHDRIALFEVASREAGCWDGPYPFANDTSRFEYFAREGRDPAWAAFEKPDLAEVAVLSGLPGSGKDTWVDVHANGREVISLDAIREELGISPKENQGAVAACAQARMRELLRRGESFVFNATNLTKRTRAKSIRLAVQYGARVQIVCIEAEYAALMARNGNRGDRAVPERVIAKMVSQWEFPSTTECHSRTVCE